MCILPSRGISVALRRWNLHLKIEIRNRLFVQSMRPVHLLQSNPTSSHSRCISPSRGHINLNQIRVKLTDAKSGSFRHWTRTRNESIDDSSLFIEIAKARANREESANLRHRVFMWIPNEMSKTPPLTKNTAANAIDVIKEKMRPKSPLSVFEWNILLHAILTFRKWTLQFRYHNNASRWRQWPQPARFHSDNIVVMYRLLQFQVVWSSVLTNCERCGYCAEDTTFFSSSRIKERKGHRSISCPMPSSLRIR